MYMKLFKATHNEFTNIVQHQLISFFSNPSSSLLTHKHTKEKGAPMTQEEELTIGEVGSKKNSVHKKESRRGKLM